MYDENLAILEGADYIADTFWLDEEPEHSFHFDIDEEMDMVALDRTSFLVEEMSKRFDENKSVASEEDIICLKNAARRVIKNIEDFLMYYNKLREMEN